jgi:hypothetical protein
LRLSKIVRYPRTRSFKPPEVFGWDEHTRLRLDLSTNPPQARHDSQVLGLVNLQRRSVQFVPCEGSTETPEPRKITSPN